MIASNSTSNDTLSDPFNYAIAGGAGGAGMVLLLCIAASIIFCRCSNKKRQNEDPPEERMDIDLDAPIVPPNPGRTDYVNEQAVENIHKKAKFNLRKVIGEALAEQIRGLILESERLTTAETLGTGNFGVVTKGYLTDKDSGNSQQTVAVKSITGDDISAKDMKNFIQEILRMRHFNHPNVLNMLGLVIERNMPKVVMPFMSNGDLRTFISNPRNVLVARDLLDYARQVADGMDYLHAQNFVHRDLAARNCMVDHNTTVKVADFGLSRDIFNADYYKGDDKAALPVRWMAIESLRDKRFSSKSDVWSFGVLLWELFTRGATPYPTLDNNTVYEYVKKGERLINPSSMSDNVGDLMRSCWAKEPMKRPSCKEISDQLTKILTVPEPPPSYDNLF